MDKLFKMNAVTFFSERYGSLTAKFRKENERNIAFLQSMDSEREQIKNLVPADVWQRLNNFIELMELHSDVKGKYFYAQGMKDFVSISHYLDTEFVNSDLEEIWNNVSDL